jgi:sec-independent protein translocase protein TatA
VGSCEATTTKPALEDCMGEGLFQPMHLLVIGFIALLVFGPKKLPELGKGLGDGIRAFKEGMKEPEKPTAAGVNADESKHS